MFCDAVILITDIAEARERKILETTMKRMGEALGRKIKGGLNPFLPHTNNTPRLLEEYGVEYQCDYNCDDPRFVSTVRGGKVWPLLRRHSGPQISTARSPAAAPEIFLLCFYGDTDRLDVCNDWISHEGFHFVKRRAALRYSLELQYQSLRAYS